jgi:nucleotide-binding universal stress UspA family protein
LLVVHVLTRSDFVDLNRTDTDETDEAIPENQIRDTGADIAADQAQSVTDEFRSVGLVGDPAAQIINHAKEEDASFIVTSGRRRSSAGKVLFGSVTQSVILSAECPVLTVMDE